VTDEPHEPVDDDRDDLDSNVPQLDPREPRDRESPRDVIVMIVAIGLLFAVALAGAGVTEALPTVAIVMSIALLAVAQDVWNRARVREQRGDEQDAWDKPPSKSSDAWADPSKPPSPGSALNWIGAQSLVCTAGYFAAAGVANANASAPMVATAATPFVVVMLWIAVRIYQRFGPMPAVVGLPAALGLSCCQVGAAGVAAYAWL
jgi:hypothetical protein